MNPKLEEKIVLITGVGAGDSGRIGRGAAVACAFEGADIWAVGPAADALAPLQDLPGIAIRVADMADPNRLATLTEDIGAIDVLINITRESDPNVHDAGLNEIALDLAWAATVKAPAQAILAFLPVLLKRSGAIINIAPPSPDTPDITHETAAAALCGFSASIAARYKNMRCNTLYPGRLGAGSVESIAQACLYLASASGADVTGQTLKLGGGGSA